MSTMPHPQQYPSGLRGEPVTQPEVDETAGAARFWWVFLITGIAWLLFALVVFRLDLGTVTAIGIAVGVVCIVAGVNELAAIPASRGGWKVARGIFGVLFAIVGILALAYPHRTFVEVAAIFSFFLVLKGVFDIAGSLMVRGVSDVWWIGLTVGVLELLLGFWAAGNFGRESVLLVVWVGASALAYGVTQIVFAIRLRDVGRHALPPPAVPVAH